MPMARSRLTPLFAGLEADLDEHIAVDKTHSIEIRLRRFSTRRERVRGAAVLMAGGNTGGETFLVPEGGLARYLNRAGWDVFLLDWRSSPHVVGPILDGEPIGGSFGVERSLFTLDEAANKDVPLGIARVRELLRGSSLAVVGHCLGGGTTSLAIARGNLQSAGVTSFVLTTMGLFYEVPWDGWVKSEDFLIERVIHQSPECRDIDPHESDAWPPVFKAAFRKWPRPWLYGDRTPEGRMLAALTFMFGRPYATEALHPSLQGPAILDLFGPIHLGIYLHVGQMVRRGYAARFDDPDVIDRARLGVPTTRPRPASDQVPVVLGDLDPTHFGDKRITLFGASENRLWHRDSIDLMYEWLRSYPLGGRITKQVLVGYGIQEIYWGKRAERDVYPLIEAALE